MTDSTAQRVDPNDPAYRLRALAENAVGHVLVEADHWMSLDLRNRVAGAALDAILAELVRQKRHEPLTDDPCGVIPTGLGRQAVTDYRAIRREQHPRPRLGGGPT